MIFHFKHLLIFFGLGFFALQAESQLPIFSVACNKSFYEFLEQHVRPDLFLTYKENPPYYSRAGQLLPWTYYREGTLTPCQVPVEEKIDVSTLKPEDFRVRVLLHEFANNDSVALETSEGFGIAILGSSKKMTTTPNKILIARRFGGLMVNGHLVKSGTVTIVPHSGMMSWNDGSYQGAMVFTLHEGTWLLINQLELEDYLYAVLHWESWPGWPLEVNKAFAIACRSYALAQVLEHMKLKNKKPYHIKNSNIHQTYRGFNHNAILREAVAQTRGIIMTHQQKPIMAMFDCCCGGIIPADMENVDFKKSPYLARSIPCTFCKGCNIYTWNKEYSTVAFLELLRKKGHKVRAIKDISLGRCDKAGIVKSVVINEGKRCLHLPGRKFYSLCNDIRSFCFTVKKNDERITVAGKGYGHHLGICQWGARSMVDHGFNYREILEFYYPGISFMKLAMNGIAKELEN